MDDKCIIQLYLQRDETAIRETDARYGPFCRRIAGNILTVREDAEECVNDAWFTAWNRIPPVIPASLRAFLGRITRDLAITRYRAGRAQKRYAGMDVLLSELDECVPAAGSVEESLDAAALGELLSAWLQELPEEDRTLFVRRYWNGEPLQDLARAQRMEPAQLAQRMYRLRQRLRAYLEKEGIAL